jgi:hypothetical protein
MRKSNFALGEHSPNKGPSGSNVLTSNQANYQPPPESYKAVTIDPATKADLRKSHWGLGGWG